MLEICEDLSLSQHVEEPTHLRGNILDLVFTSNKDQVENIEVIPGLSDHHGITFNVKTEVNRNKKKPRKVYLFRKANEAGLREELIDLNSMFFRTATNKSIERNWNLFKSGILDAISKHIPTKILGTKQDVAWMTYDIKRMIKARKRLYKKCKSGNDQTTKKKHDKLSQKIKGQLKTKVNDYINGILEENIKSKPKKFWRFIRSKRNENMGVSPLINSSGKLVTDSKGKADVLNKQYQSVFTQEKTGTLPDIGESSIPSITDITFTIPGIEKLLKGLDTSKSNGPDEIPLRILKECASEIAPMLTFIMQQSYDTGTLPDDWKNANVVALFKKGDRSKAENYRPVSLTAVTCKMMEHVIHKQIMIHVNRNNILVNFQYGFREKHSCESQLIMTVESIQRYLNRNKQEDVLVLDFSKAFDTVAHQRLLLKLNHYGIRDKTLGWIRTWLTNRKQRVVVDGDKSEEAIVTSGVPQGTVLGPLISYYISMISEKTCPKEPI